jgi:hypothetical protein
MDAVEAGPRMPGEQMGLRCPIRPRAMPPAALPEQAFRVQARGDEQRLGVHLPQTAQAEPPEAVPVFALVEERLDPNPMVPGGVGADLSESTSCDVERREG